MDNFLINKVRNETPGLQYVTHFNNAGASLLPAPVLDAVREYLEQEARYGAYETARRRTEELEKVYSSVARLINAEPDEIAILENATAAWNMAFHAIDFKPGDRILTSAAEYASNYINFLHLSQKMGEALSVEVIPNDEFGQTSVEGLKTLMDKKVKLIAITHMPTNGGLVNPAEEIGAIARQHGCLYLLDACQSAGHYPVDVKVTGCDIVSATGRKYLRGPRGTGFLYVNRERLSELSPPFLDLHSAEWVAEDRFEVRDDARRFENWESNNAGILGLNKAVEYALELGMDKIWDRVHQLGALLRHELAKVPAIRVHDTGKVKSGIVTFTVGDISAGAVRSLLEKERINVSVSTQNSTLIDMKNRKLDSLVRASVHYYNTEEELELLVDTLKKF